MREDATDRGMLPRFDLVAFDLYGTLDVRAWGAGEALGRARRRSSPAGKAQPSGPEMNRAGRYQPWIASPRTRSRRWRLTCLPQSRGVRGVITVPAYPETGAALAAAGRRVIAVLQRHPGDDPRRAPARADQRTTSAASTPSASKPDPRVYAPLDDLGPRDRTLFVSANGWDAEGAKRDGRTVAFLERGNRRRASSRTSKHAICGSCATRSPRPDWRARGPDRQSRSGAGHQPLRRRA
jgi:FMN phosphatase YigB (HAD superfamily)